MYINIYVEIKCDAKHFAREGSSMSLKYMTFCILMFYYCNDLYLHVLQTCKAVNERRE